MNLRSSLRIRSLYMRFKYATLSNDMANRIFYSALPGVADPTQVALTKGIVDERILRAAASGAEKIIKYGTQACLNELRLNHNDSVFTIYEKADDLFSAGKATESLKVMLEGFAAKNWAPGYGGPKWHKIAETLYKISKSYDELKKVRLQRPLAKDDASRAELYEREVELMRDVIVMMNVFDGLAHNTGSIYSKMTNLEGSEDEVPFGQPDKLTRLMDSKELENPVDVYHEIEEHLEGGGNKALLKDWMSKFKQHPEYSKRVERAPKHDYDMKRIRLRKEVMPLNERIGDLFDQMVSLKDKMLRVDRSSAIYAQDIANFRELLRSMANVSSLWEGEFKEFADLSPNFLRLSGRIDNLTEDLAGTISTQTSAVDITEFIHRLKPFVNEYRQFLDSV